MGNPEGLTQIGRISAAHGIKGELKVHLVSDDTELFAGLKEAWLMEKEGDTPKRIEIKKIRPTKDHWIIIVVGVTDRNQSEALKGLGVWVPDEWLRPLEEGEYFIHDAIGADVFDLEGKHLGRVENYFETGEYVTFEVRDEEGIFLFPGTAEVLREIDGPGKRVVIDPLPGLLELNRKPERS